MKDKVKAVPQTADPEATAGDERLRLPMKKYVAAAFGGLFLVISDLVQNDTAATTLKLQEVLRQNFFPKSNFSDYGALLAMLFITVIACMFCWLNQPRSNADAFAWGASVFAVMTAITPYKGPTPALNGVEPQSETNTATPSSSQEPGSSASLFGAGLFSTVALAEESDSPPEFGTAVLFFKGPDGADERPLSATLRDAKTAEILGKEEIYAKHLELVQKEGSYTLEIEGAGLRRGRMKLMIVSGRTRYRMVELGSSSLPIQLQRLFSPSTLLPLPLFRDAPARVSMKELAELVALTGLIFPSSSPERLFSSQPTLYDLYPTEVVIDRATDLMWQRSGSPALRFSQFADEYVQGLNKRQFGGFSDWRLPTSEELLSLLDYSEEYDRSFNSEIFDPEVSLCWSADKGWERGGRIIVDLDHRFGIQKKDSQRALKDLLQAPSDYLSFVKESWRTNPIMNRARAKAVRRLTSDQSDSS